MGESVLTFASGDMFVFTIRKSLVASPLIRWVNRYEVLATGDGTLTDLGFLGAALLLFERMMHFTSVHFDQWEVATWVRDSVPYNPEAFFTQAVDEIGLTTPNGDMLDLVVCGLLRRQAITGRNGIIALRGCLGETDVEGTPGNWRFSTLGAIRWTGLIAVAIIGLADYLPGGASVLRLVMIDQLGTHIRGIITFVAGKISNIKRDHVWFNKIPITAAQKATRAARKVAQQTPYKEQERMILDRQRKS